MGITTNSNTNALRELSVEILNRLSMGNMSDEEQKVAAQILGEVLRRQDNSLKALRG
jgi:hypothetical protein